MTQEEQKYLEDLNDMQLTAGWKTLIEELKANAAAINSVTHTKDEADLYFRKGQLNVINSIINLTEHVND
jgi:hypothetical protein